MTVPQPTNDPIAPAPRWRRFAAAAVLALAASAVLAAGGAGWIAAVLGVAALAALFGAARPREGWRLIGPHFYFDLIRMARKGRTTLFRVLFLLALLGGLGYNYRQYGQMKPSEPVSDGGIWIGEQNHVPRSPLEMMGRFNSDCVFTWFLVQNLAVLVLTPAYVGGSIAEERERGTLDLLFSSGLYDRQIVLGKFAARVLHLGGFLLAGLPIFSMMQVWGGVDLAMLLSNWINSVWLLVTVSSLCIALSTMPISATSAVVASYCVVLPFGICCMSTTFPFHSYQPHFDPAYYAAYATITVGSLALSVRGLRHNEWPPAPLTDAQREVLSPTAASLSPPIPLADPAAAILSDAAVLGWEFPPMQENALLWKERDTGRTMFQNPESMIFCGVATICLGLGMVLSVGIQTQADEPASVSNFLRIVVRTGAPIFTFAYAVLLVSFAVGVTFRAAASVVRERQMQTLDTLLTLPIGRSEIVWAKALGAILKGKPWLVLLLIDVLLGAVTGAFHPFTVAYLLVWPFVLVFSLCGAGLLISTLVRTVLQANLVMAGLLLGIAGCVLWTAPGLFLGFGALTFSAWDDPSFTRNDLLAFGAMVLMGLLAATVMFGSATFLFERVWPTLMGSDRRDPRHSLRSYRGLVDQVKLRGRWLRYDGADAFRAAMR